MLVKSKHFGEIELTEDKILNFENGILGFEDHKKYTILYDSSESERPAVSWLQCCDIPELAIPVISPLLIKPDYNPVVDDELIQPLEELTDDNLVILLTLTVPADIKNMSVNLKAPIIINADNRQGAQVIAENNDYEVKFKIYELLQEIRERRA